MPSPSQASPSQASPSQEVVSSGAAPASGALDPSPNVTQLLRAWEAGDPAAADALMRVVYGELHRMAEIAMAREAPGHTLQPTALVHEAYLRLVGQTRVHWQSRAHFFGVAALAMRRILVDYARRRRVREGDRPPVTLPLELLEPLAASTGDAPADGRVAGPARDEARARSDAASPVAGVPAEAPVVDMLALDDALTRFAAINPRQARVVELRYFGGRSLPKIADVLGVSQATVERDWAVARGWLRRELGVD